MSALTVWFGTPHQFPIYGDLLINLVFAAIGLLRLHRGASGLSPVERGLERLPSPPLRKAARVVALVGSCNALYFCVYFLPYAWFAMSADAFPRLPSYLLSGICGRGTVYACPSREAPTPSRTTRALVGPQDPRLPASSQRN